MNYYRHHIGDYDQATRHLSFVEDAAYSRMIRKYYAEEAPLPKNLEKIQKLIGARTKEEKAAVQTVLEEFFVLEDDGYHNSRCDSELEAARAKAQKNRENGRGGGRPKKSGNPEKNQSVSEKNPTGYESETQWDIFGNPSHKPLATIEPTGANAPDADASLDPEDPKATIWKLGVRLLVAAGDDERQARSFLGRNACVDESKLAEVIGYLSAHPKIEPKAYIAKAMQPEKRELAF